jgi:prophage maintenance system killer protein
VAAEQRDVIDTMPALAAGALDETSLAVWFRERLRPLSEIAGAGGASLE